MLGERAASASARMRAAARSSLRPRLSESDSRHSPIAHVRARALAEDTVLGGLLTRRPRRRGGSALRLRLAFLRLFDGGLERGHEIDDRRCRLRLGRLDDLLLLDLRFD